jgi:predicted RNA-binding protein (virulence factor B family)
LTLQKTGKTKADDSSQKILEMLVDNGGMLPYNYKSDAEQIQKMFGLSKKNFKLALTKLSDTKKITIKENGIYGI